MVEEYDKPLSIFIVKQEDGSSKRMAQLRRVGIKAQMVDLENPGAGKVTVDVADATPVREFQLATEKYSELLATTGAAFG